MAALGPTAAPPRESPALALLRLDACSGSPPQATRSSIMVMRTQACPSLTQTHNRGSYLRAATSKGSLIYYYIDNRGHSFRPSPKRAPRINVGGTCSDGRPPEHWTVTREAPGEGCFDRRWTAHDR